MSGWNLLNYFAGNNSNNIGVNTQTGNMGNQSPSTPWTGIDGSAQVTMPQRLRDVLGKLKVSQSQNIYDADFEYGVQPLRWEQYINNVSGNASIVSNPNLGGVTMTIGGSNSPGDVTLRQSRPYHRYQPGKTFFMASNVNFGATTSGQFQRVGIFDDSNGVFFMQAGNGGPLNPYSMNVVLRSDAGNPTTTPIDKVFPMEVWNGNAQIIQSLDWTKVQMIWMEYAWYGAGAIRWGVYVNGEPWILHQLGTGNATILGAKQTAPWSRTGNLPVRYEQRNATTGAPSVMTHYGVSVLIEGSIDQQRGFTYSYGNNAITQNRVVPATSIRFPALSFRMRPVGADQFDNTNAAITAGTQNTLTINPNTPTINTFVGQYNNGQSLLTFASAHGFGITNPALANNPPQFITLGAITNVGTVATGNYSFVGTTLTVTTAVASGGLYAGQVLSGTGVSGTPTIVSQLTATNSPSATPVFASGGAVGSSVVFLNTTTGVLAGQLVSGTGIPNGTTVTQVNGLCITISNAFTVQASGTYNFYTLGSTGTYQVSTAQTTGSGTLTATTTYAAQTWQIINVPTTTTLVLSIAIPNGVTPTSFPSTGQYWAVNQWVGRILYYQATLPYSSATVPTSTSIAGVTTYTSTLTFSANHNLNTGDIINITGATGGVQFNGQFSITRVSATQLSITGLNSTTAIGGTPVVTTPLTGRIISNTSSVLTFQDIILGNNIGLPFGPSAGNIYQIGLTDRGQLLPQTLLLNSSATCLVELISSTPTNQLSLSQSNFVNLNNLGSYNSFAQQDLSSTSLSGGEVVYAFSTPPNGLQQLDLTNFFPVLTNIKGNVPDILTVAVTSSAGATVQINVICQEAMA